MISIRRQFVGQTVVYNHVVRFRLSMMDQQLGELSFSKATECYKKSLEINSLNPVSNLRMAAVFMRVEGADSAKALDHLIAALENSPEQALGLGPLFAALLNVDEGELDNNRKMRIENAINQLNGDGRKVLSEIQAEAPRHYRYADITMTSIYRTGIEPDQKMYQHLHRAETIVSLLKAKKLR